MLKIKRARKADQKTARRQDILTAAWDLFQAADGNLPTVNRVARRAGLSKGTIYLYFASKEELFFSVFESRIEAWVRSIETALEKGGADAEIADLSRVMTRYAAENPLVIKLGTVTKSFVERNIDNKVIYDCDRRIASLVYTAADAISERFSFITRQQASQMLVRAYALSLGLWQVLDRPPAVSRRLLAEGIDIFTPAFGENLLQSMEIFINGYLNYLKEKGKPGNH